jgi:23S rRNA pseudouridine955/2504/2580 synthase/23S rRNA pseudouridine1911/1915/1917 synthase
LRDALQIIYQDNDLVAINKPSGWLTIPDRYDAELPSVKKWFELKGEPVFIVHRIDRDTSGLLLLARNEVAHKFFNQQFEQRTLTKTYFGLVTGNMTEEEGTFDQPIESHPTLLGKMRVGRKGKSAITHYKVEQRFKGYTWVRFQIETGRTHQIRVHLQNAGHALVCDPLYGNEAPLYLSSIKRKKFNLSKHEDEERPLLSRLALHASSVESKGLDGKEISITAPLSKDLDATLKQLSKWGA